MSPRPFEVDIRAHYAAPSTKDDDTRYRAQAAACIAFQPVQRSRMNDEQSRFSHPDCHLPPSRDEAILEPAQATLLPQYIDETQIAVQVLQSQLDSSLNEGLRTLPAITPLRNIDNCPAVTTPSTTGAHASNDLHRPLSVTSSHLQTPIFERPAKRRKITDDTRDKTEASRFTQEPIDRSSSQNRGQAHALHYSTRTGDTASATPAKRKQNKVLKELEQRNSSDETTSELPTTYSLSDISSDRSKTAAHPIQRSVSDPGPLTEAQVAQASARHSCNSNSTEARLASDQSSVDKSTESESLQPLTCHPRPAVTSDCGEVVTAIESIRQILPPPACIGVWPFTTHVTDRLRYLIDSPKLEGVYQPSYLRRPLNVSERGHWYFSIASWSQDLQQSFWLFLQDFVSSGASGWGIWCTWSALVTTDQRDMIKAFCWGEIVKHTYLLLYVASRSNIRKLNLQWIDSAGQIVLRTGDDGACSPTGQGLKS